MALILGILALVVFQRIVELRIAAHNARIVRRRGAVEAGAEHYPLFIALHTCFFLSLLAEILITKSYTQGLWLPFLVVFLLAQALRIWCLVALGPNWNVRIFVIPGVTPVQSGPYRFIRHPNYLAVTLEIVCLPLLFHAYYTAVVFSILNYLLLRHRIRIEESALIQWTAYGKQMKKQSRGFFWGRLS